MNKFILCAMDKSKTAEELKENKMAADAAYDAADAADAYAAAAAYDAAAAAASAADNMDYWLNRYFRRTGENREDYEKAIKELEK